jgi:hypothetical protein
MLFGIYLVENGVISCEEFYEALKLQLRTRPQLGSLAIEKRLLSVRQVFAILRSQCDSTEDLFGRLAVKLGYLAPEALRQLTEEQSRRVRPFSEILVESGILSSDEVERHLSDYRQAMENADSAAREHAAC